MTKSNAIFIIVEDILLSLSNILSSDAIPASGPGRFRIREIYHYMRDAGRVMLDTLAILHNAVIDLA